jgi:hypothetical protein
MDLGYLPQAERQKFNRSLTNIKNVCAVRATPIPESDARQSGVGTEFGQDRLEAITRAKIINMAK